MPDALSSHVHAPAFYPLDHAQVDGRQPVGAPGGPVVEKERATGQAAQTPASPFPEARVKLGSSAERAEGEAQAQRTSSSFSKFFKALAHTVATKLQAAFDRIAGKLGTGRASTMDTQFRTAHADVIKHLEKVEEGSLAADKGVMSAVFAHAAAQKSPLKEHEIRQYVAAGQKAIAALHKDFSGHNNLLRIEYDNTSTLLPSSQYLTRAIAWLIAARVAEAQIRSDLPTSAPNSLNADGEIIMPDPGHKLAKFLAAAPSATTLTLPANAAFEHVRTHKDESYNKDAVNIFKGIESSYDELQGCLDDARTFMPGAGGAMLFDSIKAGTRSGDIQALRVSFTHAQHTTFERTDTHGAVAKDSWLGNISQTLSRLWTRPAASRNEVRAASMDSKGLKEAIADPYRQLMMDVGSAGVVSPKVEGFLAEFNLRRAVDDLSKSFDQISYSVSRLLKDLKANASHPEAKAFEARALALEKEIHVRQAAFGDSTSPSINRVGAERHIVLSNVR